MPNVQDFRVDKNLLDLAKAVRRRICEKCSDTDGVDFPNSFLRRHGLTAFFASADGPFRLQELQQAIALASISQALGDGNIPFLVLKGSGLAKMLYPNPRMRQSRDIDVLVDPAQWALAAARLADAGWQLLSPQYPVGSAMFSVAAHVIKDATFAHPTFNTVLELHQRLVFLPTLDRDLRSCHQDLAPRLTKKGEIPCSFEKSSLMHYLLCHGAISGWARLKWLVDIWLLATELSAQDWESLRESSFYCHTEASAKAGLLFMSEVFDMKLPEVAQEWVGNGARTAAVNARYRFYLRHLHSAQAKDTPLGNRAEAFRSVMLVCGGLHHRAEAVLLGPISSFLRNISKLSRRRRW